MIYVSLNVFKQYELNRYIKIQSIHSKQYTMF